MSTHIITGGAGFVGANLAASLLADQHTVIAIDDLSRGREDVIAPLYGIPEFSFRKADCSNFRDLMAGLRDMRARTASFGIWRQTPISQLASLILASTSNELL